MNVLLRQPIIAGNWKMNKDRKEALELISAIAERVPNKKTKIITAVPFTDLETVSKVTSKSNIFLSAQNCHFEEKGAYTGEISVPMLKEIGCKLSIVGHSERRQYFNETDKAISKKIRSLIDGGLDAIVCVGESLSQREKGETKAHIKSQLEGALEGISKDELKHVVVAYEPIWAIGTGKTATADEAEEVCSFIRNELAKLFSEEVASHVQILYGGSMNAKNAGELLSKEDIDGGLIGGASLKPDDFEKIIDEAEKAFVVD